MIDHGKMMEMKADFHQCGQVLAAIGDETRQLIILVLMNAGCDGMRVGGITAETHLSRPAVSHHLKILKDAGIVRVYKETTMNFYYLDPTGWIKNLRRLVEGMDGVLQSVPQKR